MATSFPGRRVGPADPLYPTLATGFNQRFEGQPRYVQVCGTAEQVRQGVQDARDQGLRVTVRSGGHCYEGFVTSGNAGVILDLSGLNGVYYDEAAQAYCIEGGCMLWPAYNTLAREFGVALPGGSCNSVGAGGHIVGGGYGLLAREHGLTVDWLTGVELVRVGAAGQAEIIRVGHDSTGPAADIFWGHRGGGGGNFGIVTRYFFAALPPAPASAYLATLAWDWPPADGPASPEHLTEARFKAILRQFARFFEEHSAPGDPYRQLFAILALNHHSQEQISLTVQYTGAQTGLADDFISQMQRAGEGTHRVQRTHAGPYPPVLLSQRHHPSAYPPTAPYGRSMPWLEATQTLNGSGANQRGKYKSAYMRRGFPEFQLDVLWRHLSQGPCPGAQALLQVDSYGGRVNDVAPAATAVPQRSSILKLQYQIYWPEPACDEACLGWLRDFYEAMYGPAGPRPDADLDGCYVNYPDVDLPDWQHLYYLDNYPRLQRAKLAADPLNVFYHAQSIELP